MIVFNSLHGPGAGGDKNFEQKAVLLRFGEAVKRAFLLMGVSEEWRGTRKGLDGQFERVGCARSLLRPSAIALEERGPGLGIIMRLISSTRQDVR